MAAPAPRRAPRRDTRRAIVDAALTCLERDGIAAASMEDIADAAGLTRPALYYHFASRRELMLEVLAEVGGRIVDQVRHENAFQPATCELVVRSSARMVELTLADPVARVLASPEGEGLMADLLRGERMREIQGAFWVPLLHAARDAGEVRADVDVDEVITWLVFLQLSLATVGHEFGLLGDERLRATMQRLVGPGLSAAASGAGSPPPRRTRSR